MPHARASPFVNASSNLTLCGSLGRSRPRWTPRPAALKAQGIDLSTSTDMLKDKILYPPDFQRRGLQDAIEPFREAYFAGQ
jgi:hypothetical protein